MFKNILTKLMAGAMGIMIMASAGSMGYASNYHDTSAVLSLDETVGIGEAYTNGRAKEDATSGYIKGVSSTGNLSYTAALVACDSNGGDNYFENFKLFYKTVRNGYSYYLTNYVKESGYNYAAIKTLSEHEVAYTIRFLWSPDSI